MTNDELAINRILQGGIYFMKIRDLDNKYSPYIVVSRDNGYGMCVLVMRITSKYSIKNHILPINMNGSISFIRTSGIKEIPARDVLDGQFEGIVHPDILSLALEMFGSRIYTVDNDKITEKVNKYIDELSEMRLPLKDDPSIIFNKNILLGYDRKVTPSFITMNNDVMKISNKNDTYKRISGRNIRSQQNNPGFNNSGSCSFNKPNNIKKRYPYRASDWSDSDIIEFYNDLKKKNQKDVQKKYHAYGERLTYLKDNILKEYRNRNLSRINN